MKRYGKRNFIISICLLSILTLASCGTKAWKKEAGKLSDAELIDQGLMAFEDMKNGQIHIETKKDVVSKLAKEGQSGEFHQKRTFDGSFELRPDHILGKYSDGKKSYEYYGDSMAKYTKSETESQWGNHKHVTIRYFQPVGINQQAVYILQSRKNEIGVSREEESFTLHFESKDPAFLAADGDILTGANFDSLRYGDKDVKAELKIELKLSNKDCQVLGVNYTCHRESSYSVEDLQSQISYDKVNTGVCVKVPEGIAEAVIR